MSTKHKHYDLIVAWAGGALIQGRPSTTWDWMDIPEPKWSEHAEYRIKPKPKVKKWKWVFYNPSLNCYAVSSGHYTLAKDLEKFNPGLKVSVCVPETVIEVEES